MNFPKWTKLSIYGALSGAIAVSILGFPLGGWTTNGSAQTMVQSFATDEVTSSMLRVCLNASAADPEREKKLAILRDRPNYCHRKAMIETG